MGADGGWPWLQGVQEPRGVRLVHPRPHFIRGEPCDFLHLLGCVWLAPDEDPAALAGDAARLPVIAIDFPQFTDGRGYSHARLLRERYGYTGEIRAIGDVLRDQLFFMQRCGFDAFAVRPDRDPYDALKGLSDFSVTYQTGVDQPLPLFRRR